MLSLFVHHREHSTAGNRKEDVSASVAMVHSIPELIVSEEVMIHVSSINICQITLLVSVADKRGY